ncbi:MAG: hypothetical protein ACRDTZ_05390 [Pseudonocardiaceae bacterium]
MTTPLSCSREAAAYMAARVTVRILARNSCTPQETWDVVLVRGDDVLLVCGTELPEERAEEMATNAGAWYGVDVSRLDVS